jgi:hypothetical protein
MANHATQMPRPKSDKDSQVTIVLPGAWLDEATQIAERRSEPGLTLTRSDVLRMALRRGLDVMAEEPKGKRK